MSLFRKGVILWIALLLMGISQGCASKYHVKAPDYAGYEGEINQHTRLIRADRDKIFQLITQEKSFQSLCPDHTIFTHKTPPPYQVGTQVNTKIDHIFKLQWNTQVEDLIPAQKIRLRFLDGFFAGGTELWEFEEEGDAVRVTHTIVVKPKGLRKIAWLLKARRKHDEIVESVLDNLKKAVETP
jgi:ribosome-associated toxin RatA of RatAB toxin-antitoxin module